MVEKILRFSVIHRFLVVLIIAGIATYGAYLWQKLPIDAVPDVTNNQVQINTLAESLGPVAIEKQITLPIENALSGIPGLESTRSLSRNGFSQVTAIFEDHVNIYFARQQITERLAEIRDALPPGSEPHMGPMSTGLGEVFMWSVEYEKNPFSFQDGSPGWQSNGTYLTPEGKLLKTEAERVAYLRTVQDWIIKPQMKGIRGLAGVDAIGGHVMQYHVQPHPHKMISLGVSFSDILEALERNNTSIGAGYIEQNGEVLLVKTDARIETPEQIGNIVIDTRNAIPIRLKDVAEVVIGKEQRSGSASKNGEEVVIGTAMMLIGSNSRIVAGLVGEKLDEVRKSLPPGITAHTLLDRTKLIDGTIHTVLTNLAEGALLVIVVLFLLLGNFRAAFITALVIPFSMLMTAIGMTYFKISGNLMSLGAIDFGLIVDGAVIIADNCLRKLADRQHSLGRILHLNERLEEVMAASKEMIRPSVFGQLIIIMVYLPILALQGIEGKMFEPMALTVIFALVAAFVISLTFVPALIAILVTGKVTEKENSSIRKAKQLYSPILKKALQYPTVMIASALVLGIGSYFVYTNLGQEFIPTLDEQDIAVQATRAPSTSLTQATAMQSAVEKAISEIPEVELVYSKTGTAEMASDPMPPDASDTFVILKPRSEWPNPKEPKIAVIERIEEAIKQYPGNTFEFTQPIQMRFNELIAGVQSDVAIKVYGDDFDTMQKTLRSIASTVRKVPGAADIVLDRVEGMPILSIDLRRDDVSVYGLNVRDVLDVIETALGGGKAGVIYEGDRRFDLVVKLPDAVRNNLNEVENLPIAMNTKEGKTFIPLKEVADIQITDGLNEISRENGKRVVMVQVNVRGTDLGSFIADAKSAIDANVKIPPGYWIDWGGQFEHLVSARDRLMIVVPICFFLILILLYSAFNSLKEALIIFTAVPLALTGGIAALWIRDMPFSISAAVGFIALSGIAVLNGLVLVTYIRQLCNEGYELDDAITTGALTRLRPVLMTALVASLGFIPMALATGAGAEVQKPLATVVIGGLISSTLLTLVLIPALYKLASSFSSLKKAQE
jgi:cobalt-zinc-cadmium resistance protein CzcA